MLFHDFVVQRNPEARLVRYSNEAAIDDQLLDPIDHAAPPRDVEWFSRTRKFSVAAAQWTLATPKQVSSEGKSPANGRGAEVRSFEEHAGNGGRRDLVSDPDCGPRRPLPASNPVAIPIFIITLQNIYIRTGNASRNRQI